MSAVDRVEVLLDGASALHGSDAVGGVVNIVLKTRFDGAETRLLTGGATQGGASQFQFGQTIGKTWDSGHVVASYEHALRDRLAGRDRDFAGNADLRPLGGTDHRRYYSSPGNILRSGLPAYAIPAGQDGAGLTASSFLPGQVNLENQFGSYDLMSRQRRDSLYLAFGQDLTPALEVSGEARATQRRFNGRGSAPSASIVVSPTNPYYASPTGAASETIAYSFQRELGGTRDVGTADTLGFSLGGLARLPHGWRLDAYGAYGVELLDLMSTGLLQSDHLNEAVGRTADNPVTAFNVARDGYFNPFIGQGANPGPILDFVSDGWSRRKTRGETRSINFKLDGTLGALPAGAIGVAIGGQVRREGLRSGGETFVSGLTATPNAYKDLSRTVKAVFAEVRAPLLGPANRRAGFERLELSAAVRREDYGGSVHSTDPKIGVIWSPVDGATPQGQLRHLVPGPGPDRTERSAHLRPDHPAQRPSPGGLDAALWRQPRPQARDRDVKGPDHRAGAAGLAQVQGLGDAVRHPVRKPHRPARPREPADGAVGREFAPFRAFVSPATNPADFAHLQALIDAPESFAKGCSPPPPMARSSMRAGSTPASCGSRAWTCRSSTRPTSDRTRWRSAPRCPG